MATREKATAMAQRAADREGKTMLVLNLNRFASDQYVVRDCDERLLFSDRVALVVEPKQEK